MKLTSLEARIAISAGTFTAVLLAIFAAFSSWRFFEEQLDALTGDQHGQVTAEQRAEAWEETRELIGTYTVTLPVAALLAALGAWWLGRRLSRPIRQLSLEAHQIDARSLAVRLPEDVGTDEIQSLARTLNLLLQRLERSFAQANRFSADASHELRTPLAIMRANLEQLIDAEVHSGHADELVNLLEENQRLSSIVDKLLLLAKADAGRLLADSTIVDFGTILTDVAEDFGNIADERSITLKGRIDPALRLSGDPALLRRLAFNLFENALKYNVPEGWIRYCGECVDDWVVFTITNSGPSIPTQVREQVFERFFRVDTARGEGSAGLGLSLCREIARGHHGDLRVIAFEEHQTTFRLSIPRST